DASTGGGGGADGDDLGHAGRAGAIEHSVQVGLQPLIIKVGVGIAEGSGWRYRLAHGSAVAGLASVSGGPLAVGPYSLALAHLFRTSDRGWVSMPDRPLRSKFARPSPAAIASRQLPFHCWAA